MSGHLLQMPYVVFPIYLSFTGVSIFQKRFVQKVQLLLGQVLCKKKEKSLLRWLSFVSAQLMLVHLAYYFFQSYLQYGSEQREIKKLRTFLKKTDKDTGSVSLMYHSTLVACLLLFSLFCYLPVLQAFGTKATLSKCEVTRVVFQSLSFRKKNRRLQFDFS